MKDIEEEEENKIDEELRVEIKKKEVGDLEEEKVLQTTYDVNKMTLEEVEKVCEQDIEYIQMKDNVKKRDEEAGFSDDKATVVDNRMMKLQQENEALTNKGMSLQKDIYRSTEAMEVIKEESCYQNQHKVTREILLHEKRIQEEQNE